MLKSEDLLAKEKKKFLTGTVNLDSYYWSGLPMRCIHTKFPARFSSSKKLSPLSSKSYKKILELGRLYLNKKASTTKSRSRYNKYIKKLEVMMEDKRLSLKEMLEEEKRKPFDPNIEQEVQSMQEQLKRTIQELRHLPEGEYYEAVTSQFQLTLEYHEKTLLISLYTKDGKNFRQMVCDEGQFQLQNGLTTNHIFQTIKDKPQVCEVHLDDSALILVADSRINRIELQPVKLNKATKLRVQFCRFLRKQGKIMKQLKELKKQFQMQSKRYQEYFIQRTPSAQCFSIQANRITRSTGEDYENRMVLLGAMVGEGVFSFLTHIHSRKNGMWIGVTDRAIHKERHTAQEQHSIEYCCWSDRGNILFGTGDGKYSEYHDMEQSAPESMVIEEGMKLLCVVEREKCLVTFTAIKEEGSILKYQVQSSILGDPHRQFVPFFEMQRIGDSISWELQ